jgi:hypothetical protein
MDSIPARNAGEAVGTASSKCILRHILESWLTHYHEFRPHQGLGNVPINAKLSPPMPASQFSLDEVVCHELLGGLLKHYDYERCAA